MTLNRRGDIGFLEAMAGAMTVCLVMTAFTAFLVAEKLSEGPEPPSFDWGLMGEVAISDGMFTAEPACGEYAEQHMISGLELRIYSPVTDSVGVFERTYGSVTDDFVRERKLISVESGNECIPAVMEAVLYL